MVAPDITERIDSRLDTPGLVAGSNAIVRSSSVTADLNFLAVVDGSSSNQTIPAGLSPDFDIFAAGFCRS